MLLLASSLTALAQDTLTTKKIKFDFSGYIDTYYSYDFGKSPSQDKSPFLYNYNRHNELNVNIALLKANV